MATPKKKSFKPVSKSAPKPKSGKKPAAKLSKPKQSKKPAAKPTEVATKAKPVVKKAPVEAKKPAVKKPTAKASTPKVEAPEPVKKLRVFNANDPFLKKQRERLLQLKDTLLDSMSGVARDSLRASADGEASAFGMHQADAGSDAYDRDFALSLISQEQDALYEIDEALKRIENATYGVCEISGKHILRARLEALPFTRYTVECQAELEKTNQHRRARQPVTSLFGLGDDESGDDDDDSGPDSKE